LFFPGHSDPYFNADVFSGQPFKSPNNALLRGNQTEALGWPKGSQASPHWHPAASGAPLAALWLVSLLPTRKKPSHTEELNGQKLLSALNYSHRAGLCVVWWWISSQVPPGAPSTPSLQQTHQLGIPPGWDIPGSAPSE